MDLITRHEVTVDITENPTVMNLMNKIRFLMEK